jgi:ribonuclease E
LADTIEGGEDFAGEPATGHDRPQGEQRRRRRRRGRRGGNRERFENGERFQPADNAAAAPGDAEAPTAPPSGFAADRFGLPDEIDTTPRDDVPAPNVASKPSWSLRDEPEIDTTPKDGSAEPASAEAAATPSEPAAPPKKGWWQRAFKSN